MKKMTVEEFIEYVKENEEQVQELLSVFTTAELIKQLNLRFN